MFIHVFDLCVDLVTANKKSLFIINFEIGCCVDEFLCMCFFAPLLLRLDMYVGRRRYEQNVSSLN